MTKQSQPDLFGFADPQGDLFASEQPETKEWKPNLDKVRRRLDRILSEARSANSMPWDWYQLNLFETVFPQMARILPYHEAQQYILEFQREIDRLNAA